ncbi:MAG TPA: hypothetical protein VGQ59_16525 [Cyclobacteriaceae bacterium]|jgi:hypothetical protein|nr:hypothetical protein [Cyclobacteriaceae bacterium]
MRKELAKEEGKRKKFKALFDRVGKKVNYKNYSEETILLKNVVDLETNKIIADHIWFSYTQSFIKASISVGDTLEFEARVKEYRKGYVNRNYKINNTSKDFKLSNPTKIKKVNNV